MWPSCDYHVIAGLSWMCLWESNCRRLGPSRTLMSWTERCPMTEATLHWHFWSLLLPPAPSLHAHLLDHRIEALPDLRLSTLELAAPSPGSRGGGGKGVGVLVPVPYHLWQWRKRVSSILVPWLSSSPVFVQLPTYSVGKCHMTKPPMPSLFVSLASNQKLEPGMAWEQDSVNFLSLACFFVC